MSATVKIKVLRAFWLDRNTLAEPGQILELDPLQVYDLSPSKAQVLGDAEAAKAAINEAAKAATEACARVCGPVPRTLSGEGPPRRWAVLPSDAGYRPHVH